MKTGNAILVIGVLVVVTVLFLGRYQFVPSTQGLFAYRLDRWTGHVRVYTSTGWREIERSRDADTSSLEERFQKYADPTVPVK
jgi:hypothetical protein